MQRRPEQRGAGNSIIRFESAPYDVTVEPLADEEEDGWVVLHL